MEEEFLLSLRKSSAFSGHVPIGITLRLSGFALHRARIWRIPCAGKALERLPRHRDFHGFLPMARNNNSRPIDRGESSLCPTSPPSHRILHRYRHRLDRQRSTRNGIFVEGSSIRKVARSSFRLMSAAGQNWDGGLVGLP